MDPRKLDPRSHAELYRAFKAEFPQWPEYLVLRDRGGIGTRFTYCAGPPNGKVPRGFRYVEEALQSAQGWEGGLIIYSIFDLGVPDELGRRVVELSSRRGNEDNVPTRLIRIPEMGTVTYGVKALADFIASPEKSYEEFAEAVRFEELMGHERDFFTDRSAFEDFLSQMHKSGFPGTTTGILKLSGEDGAPEIRIYSDSDGDFSVRRGISFSKGGVFKDD